MKRVLTVVLSLLMLCTVLNACSESTTSTTKSPGETSAATAVTTQGATTQAPTEISDASIVTPAGELPIVLEPYTLTVAIPVDAKVEDIGTTKLTIWQEETTAIALDFIE